MAFLKPNRLGETTEIWYTSICCRNQRQFFSCITFASISTGEPGALPKRVNFQRKVPQGKERRVKCCRPTRVSESKLHTMESNRASITRLLLVVPSLSCIRLLATPWTTAWQASPSFNCLLTFAQIHVHWAGDALQGEISPLVRLLLSSCWHVTLTAPHRWSGF